MKTITTLKTIIKLFVIVLSLTSCGGSKLENLLKEGSISQEIFKTTIPFEYREGLMVLKIELEGKTYDFILDTGASNVISTEIMETHNLKPRDSELIRDVNQVGQKLNYLALDNVKIGDLNFLNTITAVFDFNQTKELADLNVDGIIGANLMRKAIWDFDFKNQKITITNSEASLDIPEEYNEVKFYIGYQGTPSIITKVNNMRVLNNRIDTGFNGAVSLSQKEYQKLKKKGKINQYITVEGVNSVGMYGASKNATNYKGLIDQMNFGDLTLNPSIVHFRGPNQKLIGMEFLKNYRVIFNWETKKIKFIETSPYQNSELTSFGFVPYLVKNKLYVRSIIKESSAAKKGIQLGDQILAINNKDCSIVNREQWEELLKTNFRNTSEKSMSITIQRAGEQKELRINKTVLLNSDS